MKDPRLSIFESVTGSTIESLTFLEIINQIRSVAHQLTIEEIRDFKASGQKKNADTLKRTLPAFTPSGVFNKSHQASALIQYSGILHLDIDKQPNVKLNEIENELRLEKSVLAFFRSPSGDGLKVFFWFEGNANKHSENIQKLIAIYYRKYKIEADSSCKDLSRLCYFSHDKNAYYNEHSEPFNFSKEYNQLDNILLATKKENGCTFMEGQRNDFIFKFAINCKLKNIIKEEAILYTIRYFEEDDFDSNEIKNTINSAYSKDNESKNKTILNFSKYNQIEEAFSVLGYKFKLNTVRQNIDCWINDQWVDLSEIILNDIIRAVNSIGIKAKDNEIKTILFSSSSERYDPFKDYLNNLEPWDGHDYISDLWKTLNLENEFEIYFRKWIVLVVACMEDLTINNPYVFTLIGPQGVGKTRWLGKLIPEKLSSYMFQGILDLKDKDSKITIAENLIINLDEMDAIDRSDIARLKELITSNGYKVRAPYGKMQEYRSRRASFCASLNNMNFLMDKSGSRRFLIIELNSSVDHNHDINIDGVYAQATQIYKNGYPLFFNDEESKAIQERNEIYNSYCLEDELLNEYLRKPKEGEVCRSMSSNDIARYIAEKDLSFRPTTRSNSIIGTILTNKGFEKTKSNGISRYKVFLYK